MIYYKGTGIKVAPFFALGRKNDVMDLQVDIDCRSGYELTATLLDDVTVEAKVSTDAVYTDIGVTPLDLGLFSGQRRSYDFRLTLGDVSAEVTDFFKIHIRRS